MKFKTIVCFIGFFCVAAVAQDKILDRLNIIPSSESVDYVTHKQQFQLQGLTTEQRHPKTNHLSYEIKTDTILGLNNLLSVDQDITKKFDSMAHDATTLAQLATASEAIQNAILNHRKIYFYGTGATGRLAVLIESGLWRPFCNKLKNNPPIWKKINAHLPHLEDRVIGDITGGDRALISSLPGFEDLPLIGRLQLQQHQIKRGDVVFAITEGGETPAVIGTILAAAQLNKSESNKNLYFIYNNPDQALWPFLRSRAVLQNKSIIKINLTTGPQAIAGSTRMQATSSELYVIGSLIEDALQRVLSPHLTTKEMESLDFDPSLTLQKRLLSFKTLQQQTQRAASLIAPWTDLETQTYASHHTAFYFAKSALLPVFTDLTERAPTFRLDPLDTIDEKKSWVRVWTDAQQATGAWQILLHRPFHGLNDSYYKKYFIQIKDPYLRASALHGLTHAGDDQQLLYDLSFSQKNMKRSKPQRGDLGVLILFPDEKITYRTFQAWLKLFKQSKTPVVVLCLSKYKPNFSSKQNQHFIYIPITTDPLGLKQQLILKMLLNAHSTAVMAKLGRVVGNTMTNVNPGNLKLIGRATFLIQQHINSTLASAIWMKRFGKTDPIRYDEANAILFSAIQYVKNKHSATQTSEVALSIVRVLESLKRPKAISWQAADDILHQQSLQSYLSQYQN
jgi:N-acetylmuramic acid 6-phosphate etherase